MVEKKDEYPVIKKALWEAWRVFWPAFFAVIIIQFKAGVDLNSWEDWLPALLFSAFLAGTKAVFKWLREKIGQGNYSKWIYKVPA